MASGLDQAIIGSILDATNAVAAHTEATTPIKVQLVEVANSANSTTNGTTTGEPARASVTMGAHSTYAAGAETSQNTAAVQFTSMPAISTYQIELWDSAGTAKRQWWGDLNPSPVTTNSGDTLSFAAGAIVETLTG